MSERAVRNSPNSDRLRQGSGGLCALLIVVAPWLFAGTREWALVVITSVAGIGGVLWLASVAIDPAKTRLPLLPVLLVPFIILVGTVAFLYRPPLHGEPFMTEQFRVLREQIPGNFVGREPWLVLTFSSAALVGFLALIDLARSRVWWDLFFDASAFAGFSMAILGLAQNFGKASAILWDDSTPCENFFFATFPHYTVAGAYLNLTWPLLLGSLLGRVSKEGNYAYARISFWILLSGVAICLTALAVQTSRAAQGLGGLILLFMLGTTLKMNAQPAVRSAIKWRLGAISAAGAILMGTVFVNAPIFDASRERWQSIFHETSPSTDFITTPVVWDSSHRGDRLIESDNPTKGQFFWDRRLAWATAWEMIKARPWLGFGPGGWPLHYFHFTNDPFLKTFYLYLQFAHQSFLQFAVEWGLAAGVAWGLLWFGAGVCGFRRICATRSEPEPGRRLRLWAVTAGLSSLLVHACFEFPLEIPAILWQGLTLAGLLWTTRVETKKMLRRRSSRLSPLR